MVRNFNKSFVTLLGVGIFGLTGLSVAHAQANGTPAPMTSGQMMPDSNGVWEDPAPIDFPIAAPGAQDLMHYKDYSSVDLMPGSVEEARYEMMRMKEQKRMALLGPMKEMEVMSEPYPIDFPMAAPGAQDLMHFHGYAGMDLMPGSVHEMREENQRKMDEKTMALFGPVKDDTSTSDPFPVDFPIAAPGAQDLMHYKDYSSVDLVPGSVAEAREEMMRMKSEAMVGTKK